MPAAGLISCATSATLWKDGKEVAGVPCSGVILNDEPCRWSDGVIAPGEGRSNEDRLVPLLPAAEKPNDEAEELCFALEIDDAKELGFVGKCSIGDFLDAPDTC